MYRTEKAEGEPRGEWWPEWFLVRDEDGRRPYLVAVYPDKKERPYPVVLPQPKRL